MTRGVAAALGLWTVVATGWVLLFYGGQVASCLGPLGVTPEECRAATGLPPDAGLDLGGVAVLLAALVVGWATIILVAVWRSRRDRA